MNSPWNSIWPRTILFKGNLVHWSQKSFKNIRGHSHTQAHVGTSSFYHQGVDTSGSALVRVWARLVIIWKFCFTLQGWRLHAWVRACVHVFMIKIPRKPSRDWTCGVLGRGEGGTNHTLLHIHRDTPTNSGHQNRISKETQRSQEIINYVDPRNFAYQSRGE